MKILPYPDMNRNHRSELDQWRQAAADPESPEAIASEDRARAFQRDQRILMLAQALREHDLAWFDRMFVEFFKEDPAILSVMSARVAAKATVRQQRRRKGDK